MIQERANIGVAEPHLLLCECAAVTLRTLIDEHGSVGLASWPISLRVPPAMVALSMADRMLSIAPPKHCVLHAAQPKHLGLHVSKGSSSLYIAVEG